MKYKESSIFNVFNAALKFLKDNNISEPEDVRINSKMNYIVLSWSQGDGYRNITVEASINLEGLVQVELSDKRDINTYHDYWHMNNVDVCTFNFHNVHDNEYIKTDGRYYLIYSSADQEYIGLCLDYPYMSYLDKDQDKALQGIKDLIESIEKQNDNSNTIMSKYDRTKNEI